MSTSQSVGNKPHLLLNLPSGFYESSVLQPAWKRLEALVDTRQASHNTAEEIADDLAWADAVLMWSWPSFTPQLLQSAPRLRWSGHIDITQSGARAALDHGLAVSVSRSGFSPAVAEIALSLILSTLRQTSTYHAQMRLGDESWVKAFPDEIPHEERQLTGRSVGIIGLGAVGRRLAELLQPFGTDLRVVDPFVPQEVVERFGAKRVEINELIEYSDVVVLCAASNSGTRHLIGALEIELFRPQAVFVNVARAALVDTNALVERLERNDLYAALDVFDREPLAKDSPLRRLPNAYLTPHRAGGVLSSVERIINWLIDDFEAHLNGQPPKYALTEKMLPSLDA
jgi:phosphoglycerate dehydrogenase-like enzyme